MGKWHFPFGGLKNMIHFLLVNKETQHIISIVCISNRTIRCHYRVINGKRFGPKRKGTWAKSVTMATSRYVPSCFFLQAQYWCQFLITPIYFFHKWCLDFVICLHAVLTNHCDIVNFYFFSWIALERADDFPEKKTKKTAHLPILQGRHFK